ncbi:MAG: recombinase family protein, partial [Nocardioides sp.]
MTTSKPRSAIGYARISDARGGVRSLEDQQHDMRAAAERLGWTITTMLVEPDTSAWKRRKIDGVLRVVRPVFHQALELLTSGR